MTTFLAAIFVFGLLVATHELGHFTVAKLSGIKVLEFAIGMGPKILKFTRKETDYTLRLLPIGGYVKMLGEEEDSDDPRAFSKQNPWKRLAVILAGAIFNIITAIILFTLVFINQGEPTTTLDKIQDNSPAYEAKLQKGDKILGVNNNNVKTWDEFKELISGNKGEAVTVKIDRDGSIQNIKVTPKYDEQSKSYIMGISPTSESAGFFNSIKKAGSQTFESIGVMLDVLGQLITGNASMDSFGGPVAIVNMSGQAAQAGIWTLIYFAGFLSINLAVFNLIPFPALDGGWAIIILIEALTGKKINPDKLGILNFIGFVCLMILVIFVTFKDVLTLFK